ncbi:serine/threonine-protein kinase [Actinomadura sp. DC4]|uniref:WD40 repeat domain-containing serine/threonine protein kinase n=1 Tax=Actinomadura sp. DC4 TaxID=3055069 RepID=UPI0025AED565|nr:serine/threonine-protein kinase [Actinomadura sp. DC4]MDN3351579.1 serine/threonine-protein kinase [Actinomadura sp. DC4]
MGSGELVGGKYRLIEILGEGAIGVVWRAHDESLGRDVAIKEIRFPAGLDEDQVESLRVRTLREARAAARLSHPGIVTVHEVVRQDDRPWIVMELIRGRTLAQVVKADGPLSPRRVAEIGAQILDGLRAAHRAGVVHRDVKPSNVMLDGDRTVLTDFGIAALDGGTVLTQTGAMLGTPAFMAPEQARGMFATPASDLWSLGATMYAAVEGTRPFEGETVATVLITLLTADPPPPQRAGPLAPVIAGLLAKEPGLRLSADDLAGELARVAGVPPPAAAVPAGPPPRRRFRVLLAVLAVAIALTTATAVWLPRRSHPENRPRPAPAGPPPVHIGIHFPSVRLKSDTNVFSVAFSPDGSRLAGAGSDGTIRLWDVRRRVQLAQLPGHSDPIEDVRFSPDGTLLATAGDDDTVRLWDLRSNTQVAELTGHRSEVWTVDFSPDGALLASGSKDGTVRLWDVRSHRQVRVLREARDAVTAVRFSPDGATLAGASANKSVLLWSTTTWARLAVLNGHTDAVHSIAFSRDGRTLASSGGDQKVLLWDVATRLGTGVFTGHTGMVDSVAFSPDGRTLASGGEDHKVLLYDVAANTTIATLDGHRAQVDSVAFSPDGRTLATGAEDRSVRLWDLTR